MYNIIEKNKMEQEIIILSEDNIEKRYIGLRLRIFVFNILYKILKKLKNEKDKPRTTERTH